MSMEVHIESDSLPRRASHLDLYRPKHQTYREITPSSHHAAHVDIVSTWKGLRVSQAEELIFWEDATKNALETLLGQRLYGAFLDEEPNTRDMPDDEVWSRMAAYINRRGRQRFRMSLESVLDLLEAYHNEHGTEFRWLIDGYDKNKGGIIHFLRTLDIFQQNDQGSCILDLALQASVEMSLIHGDFGLEEHSTLLVTGSVSSNPHHLDFALHPNQVLKPMFHEPLLDLATPQSYVTVEVDEILYQSASLTAVKSFPGNICLERTIRLRFPRPMTSKTLNPNSCPEWEDLDTTPRPIPRIEICSPTKSLPRPSHLGKSAGRGPLRAISSGSARVQGTGGMTDFERSAKQMHPTLASAHDKWRPQTLGENTTSAAKHTTVYPMMQQSSPVYTSPSVRNQTSRFGQGNDVESYAAWTREAARRSPQNLLRRVPSGSNHIQSGRAIYRNSYDDTSDVSQKTLDEHSQDRSREMSVPFRWGDRFYKKTGLDTKQRISEVPHDSPSVEKRRLRDNEAEALSRPQTLDIQVGATLMQHSSGIHFSDNNHDFVAASSPSPGHKRVAEQYSFINNTKAVSTRQKGSQTRHSCAKRDSMFSGADTHHLVSSTLPPVHNHITHLDQHDIQRNYQEFLKSKQRELSVSEKEEQMVFEKAFMTEDSSDNTSESLSQSMDMSENSSERSKKFTGKGHESAPSLNSSSKHGARPGSQQPWDTTSLQSSIATRDDNGTREFIHASPLRRETSFSSPVAAFPKVPRNTPMSSSQSGRKIKSRQRPISPSSRKPALGKLRCKESHDDNYSSPFHADDITASSSNGSSSAHALTRRVNDTKRYCDRNKDGNALERSHAALDAAMNRVVIRAMRSEWHGATTRDRTALDDIERAQSEADFPIPGQDDDPSIVDDDVEKWDVEDFLAEEDDGTENNILGF